MVVFSVTGPSMAKTKSDAGSFLQVLKGELDGVRADLDEGSCSSDLMVRVMVLLVLVLLTLRLLRRIRLRLRTGSRLKKGQFYVGQVVNCFCCSLRVLPGCWYAYGLYNFCC
jgi:hypothetical protein